MILTKEIQEKIAALRADNTAGATALAHLAGEILVRVAESPRNLQASEIRSRIIAAGKAVIGAQPAMATIYGLVNYVLGGLPEAQDDEELRATIRTRAHDFSAQLRAASSAAAHHATKLITHNTVVLTHSRSSLVEAALIEAARQGLTLSVICTESRPLGEGRALAGSLASMGISTSVVIDAAVASFVARSTVVFVGADALSVHGLVNKIGTHSIAMAAHAAGVPMYVVTTTQRFLPPAVPLSYQEVKDPRELVGERSKNLTAINLYFDHTPLEQITGCVTEHGPLAREALRTTLASWRVTETLDLEACG